MCDARNFWGWLRHLGLLCLSGFDLLPLQRDEQLAQVVVQRVVVFIEQTQAIRAWPISRVDVGAKQPVPEHEDAEVFSLFKLVRVVPAVDLVGADDVVQWAETEGHVHVRDGGQNAADHAAHDEGLGADARLKGDKDRQQTAPDQINRVGTAGVEHAQAVCAVVNAVQAPQRVDVVGHAVRDVEHEVKRQEGNQHLSPHGQVVGRVGIGQCTVFEQQASTCHRDQTVHKKGLKTGDADQGGVVDQVVEQLTALEFIGLLWPDVLHHHADGVIREQEVGGNGRRVEVEMQHRIDTDCDRAEQE